MKNRITEFFASGKKKALNIYFTAGYPKLEDTRTILKALQDGGADLVEIGMPYSDPLADGPVIQAASEVAIENGMSIRKLFEQLEGFRNEIHVPVMLMGYINPVLQYGLENFIAKCAELGIDGIILPDLPYREYNAMYKEVFEKNNVSNIFLITPQTSDERIKLIDSCAEGFIYIVSTNSTTGNESKTTEDSTAYFERIKKAGLINPTLIGFNIKDNSSFENACLYADGAIIGSAFVKMLTDSKDIKADVADFVRRIKG